MTIRPASDRSLLISFGDEISLESHLQVKRLTHALEGARAILNLHPAFASVLVDFDPRLRSHEEIEALVRERLSSSAARDPEPPRTIDLPVAYGGECGPDLADVARHTGLSPERVVEIFAAADYVVYFAGFATCFSYLGGLPPELATPRLSAPRKLVPAGSVAIGGSQAGVYPLASPGGWRIVGRTSVRLFEAASAPPPLLRMGDHVRFPSAPSKTPAGGRAPLASGQMSGLRIRAGYPAPTAVVGAGHARPAGQASSFPLAGRRPMGTPLAP